MDRITSALAGIAFGGTIAALAIPDPTPIQVAHARDPQAYLLVNPALGESICAKSLATCETALKAIQKKWWPIWDSSSPMTCLPDLKHDCFPPRENCIEGFNCGKDSPR